MSLSVSSVLSAVAPQLSSDANRQTYIDMAVARINVSWYGANYVTAVAYLAAHIATLALRMNGDAGAIRARREGDLSIDYAPGFSKVIDDYEQTSYGKHFKTIKKSSNISFGVLGAS